jgi:HSP20 family protein
MARIYIERQDLPDDVRRLFDTIWDGAGEDYPRPAAAVECSPSLDVLETDHGIEVLVDLPGVTAASVQVILAKNVLLVAGHKLPPACDHHDEAAFHLAERAFGRFARIVRLDGAYEGAKAVATLTAGELRVAIPRIDDRRGREIRIPVRG